MPGLISFGLREPEEALAFFRQKGYAIAFDHRDVWRQANQGAFTVAKVAQMDLLADFRTHIDAAIQNGTTLQQFIKDMRPNLMRRGWWGRAQMTDPQTKETKVVQLGSPRRLKVIYETNMRTAHSEGQWQRIQSAKDTLPFLMYDHTPSPHERKEHAAWDGLVLRADDPWWQSHYPVRAWGCKCSVIQMSAAMADAAGGESVAPEEKYRSYTNKRTGETIDVPIGVDPEFSYPQGGRLNNLGRLMAERVERSPATWGSVVFDGARERVTPIVMAEYTSWITAIEADRAARLGSRRVVNAISQNIVSQAAKLVGVSLTTSAISLDKGEAMHLLASARKGEKSIPSEWVYALPERLNAPKAVLHDVNSGNLLYVWALDDNRYIRVVVQPNFADQRIKTNAIRSGHVVTIDALRGTQFTLLDGQL
ncbi:MAG: hypothetical protein C4516_04175 [Oxalobacter sp.]|nr:MAG: hypothetical protein C4516_04175 [Oxalobacter sp.]